MGEYNSPPENMALPFLAGVVGWNRFRLRALEIFEVNPYSGTERYTFLKRKWVRNRSGIKFEFKF